MTRPPLPVRPSFTVLAVATAIIVIISLSIHVTMLQVLRIPYPDASGVGKLGLLYPLGQALGLVALAAAALPRLRSFHPISRGLIVAALFAAMNGIVRNALMVEVARLVCTGSRLG